jgi:alpha-mannosidase
MGVHPTHHAARHHTRHGELVEPRAKGDLALIGHSHLDVAWLWTYEQTKRKAERTFAIACDLLDRDPDFVFVQSQPQLYKFVQDGDATLFDRVRARVAQGRFDADVAALWVESDCNVPSGESLLRQMVFANEYCTREFSLAPAIAWLPDTFGFANTLPQLLAHAGIPYFATTKLQWNDTTKFPYPQFVWEGPDGSGVIAALIQSYDGGPYPWRIARAKQRKEPLVLGYGDGGGGVTANMLAQAKRLGAWIHPRSWFEELAVRRDTLPRHGDELYLEYHRGVYTTHHDVKAHNALAERALTEAEELVAWCLAVHAPKATVAQLAARLHDAWEIVLRNQFHDVLPGTSITPVYDDVLREYAIAEELIAGVIGSAQTMLPRAQRPLSTPQAVAPREDDGAYVFDNGLLRARVANSGAIVELAAGKARSICSQANVLALYEDKPRQWDAWNVDRGYDRRASAAAPKGARIEADALIVDFRIGSSAASMRIWLVEGEPFLRVELDVAWNETHKLLRVENWLALQSDSVTYGSPHGVVQRTARAQTPAEQAKFEVPGQRFACVRNADGNGLALFTLDTYGWSARTLSRGGLKLGHSLLRATRWPDAKADSGEHAFSYAFAPFAGATNGALEQAWLEFAHGARVRLFTCEDDGVLVAACKPADDGDGVIVRVRECNGSARSVSLRCGARMTQAGSVNALERAADMPASIEGEYLRFDLRPHQIRSFRVRFSHESTDASSTL